LESVLRRLGERLQRRGVVADLYVFGGAAMALAYDARRSTRDIDALFVPHGVVLEEPTSSDCLAGGSMSRRAHTSRLAATPRRLACLTTRVFG